MKMKTGLSRYILILVVCITISGSVSAQYFYHNHRDYRYYPEYHSYSYFGQGVPVGYPYSYSPYYAPHYGLRLDVLPFGYRTFYMGPDPYYYYDGTYYTHRNNYYEVMDAPMGAKLPELPSGSKAVVVDGMKYYEHKGTYYKEEISPDNHLLYEVVGTKGKLNTPQQNMPQQYPQQNTPQQLPADNNVIGSKIESLPANTRSVSINGQKYYMAPSGTYYQEVIDGNRVLYQVVGNSAQMN